MSIRVKNLVYPFYVLIKKCVSQKTYAKIRKLITPFLSFVYRNNLNELAVIFETDKCIEHHGFTPIYQKHFQPLRKNKLKMLEIGIGGGKDPLMGGASLRMWKNYFRSGLINGIDTSDKSPHNEHRIHTFQGDQSETEFLEKVEAEVGPFDIIIDDGSHQNNHILKSFEVLFPLLKDDGIYVIEDTQTSYWEAYHGTSKDLNTKNTSMGFVKSLCDNVNHEYIQRGDNYKPGYTDLHIKSVHFYNNILFIYKKPA